MGKRAERGGDEFACRGGNRLDYSLFAQAPRKRLSFSTGNGLRLLPGRNGRLGWNLSHASRCIP